MITKKSDDFQIKLQRYVFISPDVEINPTTNLPYHNSDICIVDMDWCETNGCPPINDDGEDMDLYAILEPGEELPFK